MLTQSDHRRDSAGMTYVYPVVSRRAGGVSVGINLNPNNACNWRCIYCQVPDLTRGGPPPVDLALLERELRAFLDRALHGDFLEREVPEGMRRIADIAFSGNGEPTSAEGFDEAVLLAARLLKELGLSDKVKLRLITNGSLIDRPRVKAGIAALGAAGGEVWFKVDAATSAAIARINGTRAKPETVARRLDLCCELCATWVQTCVFTLDGLPPSEAEFAAYEELLGKRAGRLAGVHLYGLARPSLQPEASRLGRLSPEGIEALAERLRRLGLTVTVSP